MRDQRIVVLVEVALAVALAAVFGSVLKIPTVAFGGSISLAMLPLFVVALRRGPAAGIAAGLIYGVLDMALGGFKGVHWGSFFFDYVFAYGAVGLAGFGAAAYRARASVNPTKATLWTIPWMVLGGAGRLLFHVFSGVIFFAEYAPETQNVWVYSTLYNLSYMAPSLIACIILACILLPLLQKAVPVGTLERA